MKENNSLKTAIDMDINDMTNWIFYTKEEVQNFITELKQNAALEANKLKDLNQIVFKNNNLIIYWDKLNERAKLPSKRDEDAGFDIYCDSIENIILKPNETKFFTTGLRSAFPSNYWIEIKERGSTGTNLLAVRSGVIDSGYRGEWKIIIQNLGKFPVLFTNAVKNIQNMNDKVLLYPTSKAIAQVVFLNVTQFDDVEVVDDDLSTIDPSARKSGGWGSSGK